MFSKKVKTLNVQGNLKKNNHLPQFYVALYVNFNVFNNMPQFLQFLKVF